MNIIECQQCYGTGRPNGVMGGPDMGICGYCGGLGHQAPNTTLSLVRDHVRNVLERIDIKAQAGLCCLKVGTTHIALQDIRDIIKEELDNNF